MSIFKKIKKGLGIGTAKVELHTPDSTPKDAEVISGKVVIMAKSDQTVKAIKISLVEKSKTEDSFENTEYQTKEIDSVTLDQSFEIKQDEEKTIDFELPLTFYSGDGVSVNIMGVDVSISSSPGPDTTRWFEVVATVDLEGVALDPTASNNIHFT
ncbi:MAG: sporulation protein [Chloroflexi bacterium]|nr:sporulation protein [Chloroflexota bacterium]